MKILNNAVQAIQIGLEDFKNNDPRRAQSSLRNIFAGVLLLFKEQLRRMSPEDSDEVLIKQTIVPVLNGNGDLSFQGKGKKTVDVQQIRERFKVFGIIVDWKAVEEINNLRNNIEHYYTDESSSIINEVISKSFKIIRDFCVIYLEEEPIALFGQKAWGIFLEAEEVYQKEKEECDESLLKVNWTYRTLNNAVKNNIRCPFCRSELVQSMDVLIYNPGYKLPMWCKNVMRNLNCLMLLKNVLVKSYQAKHILR